MGEKIDRYTVHYANRLSGFGYIKDNLEGSRCVIIDLCFGNKNKINKMLDSCLKILEEER